MNGGNMYKPIATTEMDENNGNHATLSPCNGTMTSNGDIYKPQPIYDNTIQTRKLPDLPNTPESLGQENALLCTGNKNVQDLMDL